MRKGFTLVELLVVMAIITTLAGILMPALFRAKEQARRAVCMNNLHQIGLALHIYAQDFDEYYPSTIEEYVNLYKLGYIKTPRSFWCPSDTDPPPKVINSSNIEISYSYRNQPGLREIGISGIGGSSTVRIAWDLTPIGKRNHGKDGGNIVFMDGSVRWHRFGPNGDYQGNIH